MMSADGDALWFGSYLANQPGGISILREENGKKNWQYLTAEEGLAHPYINAILVLEEKVLVASGQLTAGGLNVLREFPEGYAVEDTFGVEDGIPGEKVRWLYQDSEGHLWITTESDGLILCKDDVLEHPLKGICLTWKEGLSDNEIKKIAESEQYFFLAGRYGLVQPYLYITDNINGSYEPTAQEIGEYAAALYEQLFTDEGHFLLIYQEYDGYMAGYTAGAQAKSVMDNEAVAILQGYLDLYNTSDLTDEEYFGQVFQKTGERIMTVTKSPWPVVGGIFGMLLLVALCFFWWKKHKEQKNLEAQQLQEMLNTPLTTFGNDQDGNGRDDAEDLAEKYERTEKAPDSTGTGES